jgi:hypothetical protein
VERPTTGDIEILGFVVRIRECVQAIVSQRLAVEPMPELVLAWETANSRFALLISHLCDDEYLGSNEDKIWEAGLSGSELDFQWIRFHNPATTKARQCGTAVGVLRCVSTLPEIGITAMALAEFVSAIAADDQSLDDPAGRGHS